MQAMRLATWNINSIRLRLPLVARLAEECRPDVICFQETKVQNESFPYAKLRKMGYPYIHAHGEKSYNGVAIISKFPLANEQCHYFGGREDCRHQQVILPGNVELHNVYVPAGGDEPDPKINDKFAHKLRFMEDLASHFVRYEPHKKVIMVGDLNIAPLPNDVWSHKQLLSVVSHTPIEVEKMAALQATLNWIDSHRHFVPESEKLYSWWSYRNRDWQASNRGRRLDHIWVSPALQSALAQGQVHKEARNWDKPSDHVPVITDFTF